MVWFGNLDFLIFVGLIVRILFLKVEWMFIDFKMSCKLWMFKMCGIVLNWIGVFVRIVVGISVMVLFFVLLIVNFLESCFLLWIIIFFII